MPCAARDEQPDDDVRAGLAGRGKVWAEPWSTRGTPDTAFIVRFRPLLASARYCVIGSEPAGHLALSK
jgi:hypothetical protein